MVKIYALVSGKLVLYVGKTMQTLKQREREHKHKNNSASSRHIPDYIDWTIKLLEEVADDQGIIKEQYYYDMLKPLFNTYRPGNIQKQLRDSDSYRQKHRLEQQRYRAKKKSEKEISTAN
jgi:hypothetical protein